MIANKVEELFNKIGKNRFDDEYCVEYETYLLSLKDIKMLYDYIEQLKKQRNCVADKVDKALEYINTHDLYIEVVDYDYEENPETTMIRDDIAKEDLSKILKGENYEENEIIN